MVGICVGFCEWYSVLVFVCVTVCISIYSCCYSLICGLDFVKLWICSRVAGVDLYNVVSNWFSGDLLCLFYRLVFLQVVS